MVSENKCFEIILENFPDFKELWEKEIEETWEGTSPGLCLDFAEFSHYIRDMIAKNNNDDKSTIELAFQIAEMLMNEGDDRVKDAVATCFLENLINAVAWERISAYSFVHLLGKESIEYCKAWDEFTGTKTPGLWEIDSK
jgi:hypothetical protein